MNTVLENVLVREYLRALSQECISLPVAQARELREQILAHLEEALPPSATTDEVRAELARLGSPRSLAAEAAGPVRRPTGRRLLSRLGRVRWWTWAALALLVPALGTGAGFLISMSTAAALTVETGPHLNSSGNPGAGGSHFTLPGAIPPHSDREIRITWISHICVSQGVTTSFAYLPLRVRVGLVTRTEVVNLDPDFALAGPSHGACG